jgi:hypothetical protein
MNTETFKDESLKTVIKENSLKTMGALELFCFQSGYKIGSKITKKRANKIHECMLPLIAAAHKLCLKNKKNGEKWSAQMELDYQSTMPEEMFSILWVFIQTGIYPIVNAK